MNDMWPSTIDSIKRYSRGQNTLLHPLGFSPCNYNVTLAANISMSGSKLLDYVFETIEPGAAIAIATPASPGPIRKRSNIMEIKYSYDQLHHLKLYAYERYRE